ncbi:MAG: type I restriction endonuclease subunit R, partial [Imperialibacter sp.]
QIKKVDVYAHPKFVEPMLDYIVADFEKSRETFGDGSIGGMVVCDSADQAKAMYEVFQQKYAVHEPMFMAAEPPTQYGMYHPDQYKAKSAALILHDVGDKEFRKELVDSFKAGEIDFLFVYNMLLTGFDAKRLKKIYLGRVVKKHNLLQTLTRVNRTYKNFRYGYVVDFADIRSEFDATNKAYFDELQLELGDEMEHYSNLFKSKEEVLLEISYIKEILFQFDTDNAELFSQQVSQIKDKGLLLSLKKALENAKSLYNLIRLYGQYDLLDKLDFHKMNQLYSEVVRHLALVNQREALENSTDNGNLLNITLEDVLFMFVKISEEELVLADELKNTLRKTREALANNFDQKDPDFVTLRDELERLFKKKNLSEISQEEMRINIGSLRKIHERAMELNRENDRLRAKYANDTKYARIHKRLTERGSSSQKQMQLFEALNGVKGDADLHVLQNNRLLDNEEYFNRMTMPFVIRRFRDEASIPLTAEATKYINGLITKEYMDEFFGRAI